MWRFALACGGPDETDGGGSGGAGGVAGTTQTPGGGALPDGVVCGPEKVDGWEFGTKLREPVESMGAAGIDGVVYLVGGWTETGPTDVGQRGDFDEEGKIGWGPTTALPAARERLASITVAGRFYVFGGDDGVDNHDTVWSTVPDATGELGAWRDETSLPVATSTAVAAATSDRVYLVGGYAGGGLGEVTRNVWSAPINADGALGAWRAETPLPEATWGAAVGVAGNGTVVAAGGFRGEDATEQVLAAKLQADGVLGEWVDDGLLTDPQAPTGFQFGASLITIGGVYFNGQGSDKGIGADLTDGWPRALLSIASLPTPRYAHAIVFAGTSLVVAGGLSQPDKLSDDVRIAEFCR